MKIKVGHLAGRQRADLRHGPGHRHDRALRRRRSRSRSPSTSTATALFARNVAVSKGSGGTGIFRSSVIVREDGKYAVSAKHDATAGARRRQHRPQELEGRASRRCTRASAAKVVVGFKKAMRKMGYVSSGGTCFNGTTGREVLAYRKVNDMNRSQKAGAGLVKKRLRRQGRLPRQVPERRRTRRGRRSPSRSWSSPRATSRSRSTRSPPASPRPRRSPATSSSTARNRATTRTGMYYSFYWHNGYAVHGYDRSARTTPPATAACAPSSPTSRGSTNASLRRGASSCYLGERRSGAICARRQGRRCSRSCASTRWCSAR